MSFLLPSGLSADAVRELERACVAGGPDMTPYPTEVCLEADRLSLHRNTEESGALHVPWHVSGAGLLMNSTATLMERPAPYLLQLELARGKVNQIRCQAADWSTGGLHLPQELSAQINQATSRFGRAIAQSSSEPTAALAQEALGEACRTADQLVEVYLGQVYQIRHARHPRLETAFGCRVGPDVPASSLAGSLQRLCNTLAVRFLWNIAEPTRNSFAWDAQDALLAWAESLGVPITGGPLIDFSSASLPSWLWEHEHDLAALSRAVCRYVEATVARYRDRVRNWHITAASNCASLLSLDEDELLLLTVRAVEAARHADPSAQVIVGLAQPWGEYMASEDRSHSPFIFADTLLRSGLVLAALDIELVMGVTPRGSYCRDLLDTSRLLDMYALLGVPLSVTLGYPSSHDPDPLADPDFRADAGHLGRQASLEAQAHWAEVFANLVVGKPYVHAVHWADASDATLHQFPHCGLSGANGKTKPLLEKLIALRRLHLR